MTFVSTMIRKGGRTVKVVKARSRGSMSLDTAFPTDEGVIHRSILAWLRVVLPGALIFHVPNEGVRSEAECIYLWRLGMISGFPDLAVVTRDGQFFALEVKTQAGVLTKSQEKCHPMLRSLGINFAVVRSIDEAKAALRSFGIETREAA